MSKGKGFTLIEMMVVMAIIGVLAAMIVPNIVGRDDSARVVAAKNDIRTISQALVMFKLDNQRYPNSDQGIDALVNAPSNAKNWPSDGYLPKPPLDPWGNEYIYIRPGGKGAYDIISLGADGAEGGSEYDADISDDDI
ncbi:MAG: type II secretion system protein GspG [Gammaproteobacteria bacterium]|nr:MAG: type II secretion system protein GspG [Gammaproteobacteria bacterium]